MESISYINKKGEVQTYIKLGFYNINFYLKNFMVTGSNKVSLAQIIICSLLPIGGFGAHEIHFVWRMR